VYGPTGTFVRTRTIAHEKKKSRFFLDPSVFNDRLVSVRTTWRKEGLLLLFFPLSSKRNKSRYKREQETESDVECFSLNGKIEGVSEQSPLWSYKRSETEGTTWNNS